MTNQNLKIFERLYARSDTYRDLPWHDPEPPEFLVQALEERQTGGHALDIGCGGGTYSLYMAKHGYSVTAIDFMPPAVAMVRQRAAEANANIEAMQADFLTWRAERQFDVILDVGCLHSLAPSDRQTYKSQLCELLAPGGDFVLIHCGRRGWWDTWPVGPRRVARADVVKLFSPELMLRSYFAEPLHLPLFMGRSALAARYWFTR
jgi:2-polyprenyl-3-methyl-5-hydroxy-6-metoxy-1,4-benzoquinol methylase